MRVAEQGARSRHVDVFRPVRRPCDTARDHDLSSPRLALSRRASARARARGGRAALDGVLN